MNCGDNVKISDYAATLLYSELRGLEVWGWSSFLSSSGSKCGTHVSGESGTVNSMLSQAPELLQSSRGGVLVRKCQRVVFSPETESRGNVVNLGFGNGR